MKLVSFDVQGRASFGAMRGADGIVDLGARLARAARQYPDLRSLLRTGDLAAARALTDSADVDYRLADIRFLPTIPNPGKIICIGVNYADRNAEYRDKSEQPKYPSVFLRTRESLVGHLQPLHRPPESTQLDYEGEIVMVIGRAGRRIPAAQAAEHVAGLTIMNEGSVRDWLRHGKFNVTQGKNFARSGALGPWLVTADELGDPLAERRVRTRVNGTERQDDTTASLLFPFAFLLSYLSTFMPLQPGDVIATGTPSGAGIHQIPPSFLQSGDNVEVEVEGVGCLRNPVIDEPPSA